MLQKEKRTDNAATLDISGRDQQDQKLYLVRNMERLTWELKRAETELWKEPPDPVLEAVAALVTKDNPRWCGTASELAQAINTDMKPNALTRHLNICTEKLVNEHHIHCTCTRTHTGRKVNLMFVS